MKGQYFSLDVIVAGIIAVIAIILLVGYWQYSLENTPIYGDALNKDALKASQLLMSAKSEYSIFKEGNPSMLNVDYSNPDSDPYKKVREAVESLDEKMPGNICIYISEEGEDKFQLTDCPSVDGYAKVERIAYIEKEGVKLVLLEMYYGY